ncbi:MAG TPA: S9 family peptidase, partial [Thermoanaerobaculia bacterium]
MRLARSVLLGSLLPALSASGELRPVRFEELAKMGRVGGVSVSPGGERVAFAVATPDVEANTTHAAIWIVSSHGGEARRLTSGEKNDSDPKFSPDGKTLAFLSNREGGSQIWTLDLAGGDPVKATSFPTEVKAFTWSPDGRWFLIASDVFPECADTACLERIVKTRANAKVKARVAERLLYRHWDSWRDGARAHIWKVPVSGGPATDLTPGDHDAPPFSVGGGPDWDVSPDGRELVYASNPDRVEAVSTNSDLWLVSMSGGSPRDITASNRAYDGSPRFSPDAKWIAFRSQKRPGFEADRFALMLYERSTGRVRPVTDGFDSWVDDFRWAPDSKSLYFASQVRGREVLYRVPVSGGIPDAIWTGGSIGGLHVSTAGRIYFVSSSLTRAAEVWSVSADGRNPSALSHVNDALFKELATGEVSERFTSSSDGKNLHAWVIKPPFFDPARRYPAVFLIHGGPQGAWIDGWSYRWNPEVWAAYGYVVYAANPRGSTGFGQDFLDAISGDWGGQVYDDLMRQADDLESLPFVDKAKIGAAGASYGGYMIAWIAGHTSRFKALVSHDGTFDTVSSNLETEELWFPAWEFKGWPWSSDLYQKWNPMLSAERFQTPTLVITSEKDYRVPFGQGLQFFTALQLRNVPSKLLMFPDEGHWVLKPGNSRLWHNTVMDWLHRYLGGAEADPRALETVYSV